MKTITAELAAHLAQPYQTLATCWLVKRSDGDIFAFTNHDVDIVFDLETAMTAVGLVAGPGVSGTGEQTYGAAAGFTASNVQTGAGLNVDTGEAVGALASPAITEADLLAGLWDRAEITVFLVNWADLTQGALLLRTGTLGEVTADRGFWRAEWRGLTQAYSRNIGELDAPSCRASLGDARCQVALTSFTKTGTISTVDADNMTFTDAARTEADGYFSFGKLTVNSGANAGLSMEIKSYTAATKTFVLQLPMPYALAAGNTYTAVAGCDKTLATCRDIFANVVNFRGEPHLPGIDKVLQVGRRS